MPFIPDKATSGFVPDAPTTMGQAFQRAGIEPNSFMGQVFGQETTPQPPTPDVLGAIASAGSATQKKIEDIVQPLANKGGFPGTLAATAAGTAGRFILPQTREEAGIQLMTLPLIAMSGVGKAAQAGTKELGPMIEEGVKFVKPSALDRVVGQAVSATAAVPERYATAIAADSSILGDKTPTVFEVGKEYQKAFKEAGMKINSQTLEKITGNPFPATDNELGKLQKIVLNAKNKLEQGLLKEDEAFIARSAAARIERSNAALKNPQIRQVASGFKSAFDDLLINSKLPNIKELSGKYFRAIAKEYFQPWFPKNKNMSPNSVRALLLLRQGVKGLGNLAAGNVPGAAADLAEGATMSPKLSGKMLQGYGAIKSGAPFAMRPEVKIAIPTALKRLLSRQQNKQLQDIRDQSEAP